MHADELARLARRHVSELTGRPAETVTGLRHVGDDWVVTVETTELERVPHTMDVLASFEVTLSPDGEVVGLRRVGRYRRSATEERRA